MRTFVLQAGVLLALFAAGTALAELFGATNLGTAAGFGQIAFAIGLIYLIARR
jgi:hypothetical protein